MNSPAKNDLNIIYEVTLIFSNSITVTLRTHTFFVWLVERDEYWLSVEFM